LLDRLGYTVRASQNVLRHPVDGARRVRGRLDRRADERAWEALAVSPPELYRPVEDWGPNLHAAIGESWPCEAASRFAKLWAHLAALFASTGIELGTATFGGWNDADPALALAVWCAIVHLRPAVVVETGVAHGVTARVILEALALHGDGRLWSIDLPAVDPALHAEIGVAVPKELRNRWTYVPGSSRRRLPDLVAELGHVDAFVHDSLHTGRNVRFELETVWPALRTGGVAFVDDIGHSLGLDAFLQAAGRPPFIAAHHQDGNGLWAAVIKPGVAAGQAPA
jgi:hypothetical protein